jgi:O-antigen/teichoic acid export membrane protein
MASVSRKIAYNVVISSSAKIIGTILALIGIGFITRYLGKEGFGEYSTILAFFSFFGALADLGLYAISTREISRPDSDEKAILSNVFTIRAIASLLIIIIAPLIVFLFPYSGNVKMGIFIAAIAYLFSSSYSVLIGLFQKRLVMDKVAIAELVGRIFQVIIIIIAVRLNWGFLAIIIALLVNMLVSFLIVYAWSKHYVRFSLKFDWQAWKAFLKESYPLGVSAIIVFAYFKLDTIMLSIMKSSSDVGVYNAAYKILENISFFPAMLVGLVMPIMSRYIFHEREKFVLVANKTFKVFSILVVPLLVGILFLAPQIIRLIGGSDFLESIQVLRILSFAIVFIFFGSYFNNVLVAGNKQKKLMLVLLFCAIFNVLLNLILIPKYSYTGAAVVSSLTEMLVAVLCAILVFRELKYRPSLQKLTEIFLGGVAMAAILYLGRGMNFFILAPLSTLIYFFILWTFKVVTAEEIASIISKRGGEVREDFEPVI